MNNTPLNPADEARLEKALEQSANGQVVSRGRFAQYAKYAQTPLNQKAFEYAEEYCATYGEYSTFREQLRMGIRAYLAVAQPEVNSVEELDALPNGTVIMATGGRWNPGHPELFLKCGWEHTPWMALDPSDRDDGEHLESSGTVLRWRCDGEARVLYRPESGHDV